MHTEETEPLDWIDRLTSRHIARGLDQIGPVAPAIASSIKRSFRFLAQDIKDVLENKEHTERKEPTNEKHAG
jgi:hypothetical protein